MTAVCVTLSAYRTPTAPLVKAVFNINIKFLKTFTDPTSMQIK